MPSAFKRVQKGADTHPVEDQALPQDTLVPIEDLPKARKPYGFQEAVTGPRGLVYAPSGVYSHQGQPFSGLGLGDTAKDSDGILPVEGVTVMKDNATGANVDDDQAKKKQQQWQKWSEDIIPALLKPFLHIIQQTSGFRDMEVIRKGVHCKGCGKGRLLEVSCIFFERIEKLMLCTCEEPALQLLSLGFFPCAPTEPSLAVDLNVLDFARELFVNAAPNTTAWCDTLEGFLSSRKFKLTTRNTLRIRFGNAMHWYSTLMDKKNLMLRDYLDLVRGSGNDSFVAADERRIKASTVFFADTGLVALLCRHDRVLWLANMTSAGEKQHYALALIKKFFQHVPLSMRLGVLYDIGCQIHRSCEKFGFLKDYLDRIVFGISVFHAYGHQWPCQLIYHPRKCEGFGLTDGEGCERFWSLIKALIPSCRVSSYHNRIYTIDTKVKHLDNKSMLGLGEWLQRKWIMTITKKHETSEFLGTLYNKGYSEAILRNEWKKQVMEQTKPLRRQSKNIANKAIEEILALTQNLASYKKNLHASNNMLLSGVYGPDTTATEIGVTIEELEKKISTTQQSINAKKTKLSVDGRLSLTRLLGNEFLQKQMNALVLKQRIRDRLRNRKFEIELLERAYRATIGNVNQEKLQKHSSQVVKRKEPGIQAHAQNYNKLCLELKALIQAKKNIPKGAIAPVPIEIDKLFQLDVDDDIWLDIGLTDDNDFSEVPAWLGNEDVRAGIKALQQYDRCLEEERRLKAEKLSMQQWLKEEWVVVQSALEASLQDQALVFQLNQRKDYLLRLCLTWEACVRIIDQVVDKNWGPTSEELQNMRVYEKTESAINPDELLDEAEWNEHEDPVAQEEMLDSMEVEEIDNGDD